MKKKLKKILLLLALLLIIIPIAAIYIGFSKLGDFKEFFPYASELSGMKQEQNYLIIFQNNNELRPTGGFISAYGILKLKDGNYSLEFADSYSLKNTKTLPEAPKPFKVFLREDEKFDGWYFRDSNFDTDFKQSAINIEKLYRQQSGENNRIFDGVFAVNFEFLEDLIGLYEIKIDGKPLTRENLFLTLEHEVKDIDTHNQKDLENRKSILPTLATELINQARTEYSKTEQLLHLVIKALNEKKILLSFKNKEVQKITENKNWGGRFIPENHQNFIYPNISNIGGRKSDRYVQKNHQYYLVSTIDKTKITYTLDLEHHGGYSLNSDIYKAYIKILLPKNTKFVAAEGDFYQGRQYFNEDGYFEGYIQLEPGEKKQIQLNFELPKNIFEINLIKQPGTNDFWQVIVKKQGENLIKSTDLQLRDNIGLWNGQLTSDKSIKFGYLQDQLPPVAVWQKFNEQNLIEINFSEPLKDNFTDITKYRITDLNYIDKTTDNIMVKQVYGKNNSIFLVTEGISRAEEERYQIELNGIQDRYNNPDPPKKQTLTVVQRLD